MGENSRCNRIIFMSLRHLLRRNYRSSPSSISPRLQRPANGQSWNGYRAVRCYFTSSAAKQRNSPQQKQQNNFCLSATAAQSLSSQLFLHFRASACGNGFLAYWKINCRIFQRQQNSHSFLCGRSFSAVETRPQCSSSRFADKSLRQVQSVAQPTLFIRALFHKTPPTMMMFVSDFDKPKVNAPCLLPHPTPRGRR